MGEYWNLDRLTQEWEARGLSRRDLMKLVGAGAGGAAITTLHDAMTRHWRRTAQSDRMRRRQVSVRLDDARSRSIRSTRAPATSSRSSGRCSARWSR